MNKSDYNRILKGVYKRAEEQKQKDMEIQEKEAERIMNMFGYKNNVPRRLRIQYRVNESKKELALKHSLLHVDGIIQEWDCANMSYYCDCSLHEKKVKFWQEIKTIIENK